MPPTFSWATLWILFFGLMAGRVDGDALVGKWKSKDGTIAVLEEDGTGTIAGIEITWKATGKDRLRIKTPDGSQRGRYTIDGTILTTEFDGQVNVLERQDATPKEKAQGEPELAATPDAKAAPALHFEGNGIVLELRPQPPGFAGFLEREGERYEVLAVPHQGSFFGAYHDGEKTMEFHTEKSDVSGELRIVLGTERMTLAGSIVGAEREIPPPLKGAAPKPTKDDLPTTRFEHSRGWFNLDLPGGWTIAEETEDGLLINPGLDATGTLDALIVVQYGRLEEEEANRKPHQILDDYEAELRKGWRAQDVRLKKPAEAARAVLVGHIPGATQEWSGKSGKKDCIFWLGGITQRDCYLMVGALTLASEHERFLPQTKRMFESIRASAPKREPALEALLAGRRISSSSTSSSGFFGTTYDFYASGNVTTATMFSGGLGFDMDVGGNVEESGPYEVVGDTVYMYFRDKQESGRLVLDDGHLVGVRFGQTLYHAN